MAKSQETSRSWPTQKLYETPEHSTLLGWLLLTTLPLLLTTRVDAHRMVLLVVPFALSTAFGVVGAVAALDEARVGRRPRQALGVVLIGLVAWLNVVAIFPVNPRSPVQSPAMIAELAGLRGEVVLVSIADQHDLGLVDLALLERQRRDPGSRGRLLADEKARALVDGAAVDPARISELVAEVGTGAVLMAPAGAFTGTAEALRDAGLEVSERGPRGARFWRAARPAAAPGEMANGDNRLRSGEGRITGAMLATIPLYQMPLSLDKAGYMV